MRLVAINGADVVVRLRVPRRLDLREEFRDGPDTVDDDIPGEVGVGEIRRDGRRFAQPQARVRPDREFLGRFETLVEFADQPIVHVSRFHAASQNRYS